MEAHISPVTHSNGILENRALSMQSRKMSAKRTALPVAKAAPLIAEVGLIILDAALNVIALDRGAATILNYSNLAYRKEPELNPESVCLPEQLLEVVRQPADPWSARACLRMGQIEYICRTYALQAPGGPANGPFIALHIERDSTAHNAISDIVNKYHLTEREQEVLSGISQGLATKEVANQMNISPNTVKAFLRLVMIKMGVKTRAGIVAKILHNGEADSDSAELTESSRSKRRASGQRGMAVKAGRS